MGLSFPYCAAFYLALRCGVSTAGAGSDPGVFRAGRTTRTKRYIDRFGIGPRKPHLGKPTSTELRDFARAGGLISYGADLVDAYRLTGVYVRQILHGAKPAELPVQQSTKIEMVINLKTAKALGVTVPLPLLGRADEVIE